MNQKLRKNIIDWITVIVALCMSVIILIYPVVEQIYGVIMVLFSLTLLTVYLIKRLKPDTKLVLPRVLTTKKGIYAVLFILFIGITMSLNTFSGHTQSVYEHLLNP